MSRLPEIANAHRRVYPSDLSDAEWAVLEPLLPAPKGFGRPRTVDLREILNSIFMCNVLGVNGKCCPMTCSPTRPSTSIGKNGEPRYLATHP